MIITPLNTSDHTTSHRKTLLYALHGWGKTTQAKHFQRRYGSGFIISGESGLSSIRSAGIDYLPFSSWDGPVDPARGIYSFMSIVNWVRSDDFKARNYKWIMIDSLTELGDLAYPAAEEKAAKTPTKDGKVNGFAIWEEYASMMVGACKWIRDLPMHVIVTALAKEGEDENGNKDHWPMVKGNSVKQQLPGIFDCVFCGIKRIITDPNNPEAQSKNVHYIITDEYKGWHGKVRDEKRRLRAVERESDVTKLFDRMEMDDDEYEKYLAQTQVQGGNK